MKNLALIAILFCGGFVFSQSESRSEREKSYQRYENGELIEDKYYLERDGERIAGQDFEMPDMDVKMAEMEARMNQMQQNMDVRMKSMTDRMNVRMSEIQNRSRQMQIDIQNKIKEMNSRFSPIQQGNSNPTSTFDSFNSFDFPIFGA